ncbi:clumping factor B-like isoform X1 [Neodiprion pinetum]|uniref:clumping factor B-like isoform X1 n=1 Tax=Neodiprion pinetum TaxID=441929 RepID=UPI001EE0FB20|nr:clumping factor B-like isoform X1 [Neodiprion pinetum]XP_046472706.1 clumping factor B-like isoform X1 [Neodiprion pinetum]XP_046472713.1 clumping factor B-like isoform X1 [Neodiprion pinetum]XP_046472722.1 clumping factor B-like isoform X1 [Neodiprion pinetum]XP_046472731.1 clumping factor B-like isoform X1 [Neodiprion pinetum]
MSVENTKTSKTMTGKIGEKLGDIVVAGAEAAAQISVGQGILRVTDRLLWIVEKSAQWSLPVQEINSEENGKTFGTIELVRPLPWIFFLPSLIMLRVVRLSVNVGAAVLGYPKLQATGMVKIIQKGRRRLRAIKLSGMRNMRSRRVSAKKEEELNEAKRSLVSSMLSTLSALSCLEASRRTPSPPPTKVYVQSSEPDATPTPEEQSMTESANSHVESKRKYSQVTEPNDSSEDSEEESTQAQLARLAAEDSEADDEDFDPTKEELATSESSSSEEDDGDYLSESEINDLRLASHLSPGIVIKDVITEELEPEPETTVDDEIGTNEMLVSVNKMTEEKSLVTLEAAAKTENDNQPRDSHIPVTPGQDEIVSGNFYSPINSQSDSIGDYTSPESNDSAKQQSDISEQFNDVSDQSKTDIETHFDNGDSNVSESSTISDWQLDSSLFSHGNLILACFFLILSIFLCHSFFTKMSFAFRFIGH